MSPNRIIRATDFYEDPSEENYERYIDELKRCCFIEHLISPDLYDVLVNKATEYKSWYNEDRL